MKKILKRTNIKIDKNLALSHYSEGLPENEELTLNNIAGCDSPWFHFIFFRHKLGQANSNKRPTKGDEILDLLSHCASYYLLSSRAPDKTLAT